MNEMNSRDYDNRDYRDYRDYRDSYRDYDNRDYDNRDYRESYRRDYDRRGGKINNRSYRNYRNYRTEDYYEELEMAMQDMREFYRKLEDIAEMGENPQEKTALMRVAQKEKENYNMLKQMLEK